MAITRAQVENLLIKRCANRMKFVGMDGTTINGSNNDLADPISTAMQKMGIKPADITNPADSDLAKVEDVVQLIDLAELRVLESIRGNMDVVDITTLERSERFSQFSDSLEKAIEAKTRMIEQEYAIGLGTLNAGSISLNFQMKGNDEVV